MLLSKCSSSAVDVVAREGAAYSTDVFGYLLSEKFCAKNYSLLYVMEFSVTFDVKVIFVFRFSVLCLVFALKYFVNERYQK